MKTPQPFPPGEKNGFFSPGDTAAWTAPTQQTENTTDRTNRTAHHRTVLRQRGEATESARRSSRVGAEKRDEASAEKRDEADAEKRDEAGAAVTPRGGERSCEG